MKESIDESFIDNPQTAEFIGFWPRLGALLIDGLIMIPLILILYLITMKDDTMMNLQIITGFIMLLYKPFMEYKYGATVGKMALGITVVNWNFQKIDLKETILRNIFYILARGINLILLFVMISKGEEMTKGFDFFNRTPPTETEMTMSSFSLLFFVIIIIEMIVLLADEKSRALHDKIGKTYVVRAK